MLPSRERCVTQTSARELGIITSSLTHTGSEAPTASAAAGQATTLKRPPASLMSVPIGVSCGR